MPSPDDRRRLRDLPPARAAAKRKVAKKATSKAAAPKKPSGSPARSRGKSGPGSTAKRAAPGRSPAKARKTTKAKPARRSRAAASPVDASPVDATREASRLAAKALRWTCPPLKARKRTPSAVQLLGQDRPMAALETGLSIQSTGYNVVVTGLAGSGRTTVVKALIEEMQPSCRIGPDRVYVHDFRDPYRPLLLNLPRAQGPRFRDDVQELGLQIHEALLAALRSRPHRMSRRVVARASEDRERRIMDALARQARKLGCELVRFETQGGATAADIYPIYEGEPITLDALSKLAIEKVITERERSRLLRARDQLMERLEEVTDRVRALVRRSHADLREMDLGVVRRVLGQLFKDFSSRWPQEPITRWLTGLGEHVEADLDRWLDEEGDDDPQRDGQNGDAQEGEATAPAAPRSRDEDGPPPLPRFAELEVHLIKGDPNGGDSDACPVVVETNPTCASLFGTVEAPKDGVYSLSTIRAGSMLRADGGYLILRARDVLRESGLWHLLKRALQTGEVEIRDYDQGGGAASSLLQPEAIPVRVKVVMIGDPGIYEHLAHEDAQFQQVFKVHAEFDSSIPIQKANLQRYADFLAWLSRSEGLRALTPDAAAAIAEFGARLAGRNDRLSTRFGELADVAREASYRCEQRGGGPIRREHVLEALEARDHRLDLTRELIEREFRGGGTSVSVRGKAEGQVNALTVLDTGTFDFGRVCRITANAGASTPTRSGLVNIEGEAELSGPIHDKGVMILEGFLMQTFAHDGPLCVQATVCFEQLYNGVEGDSATCAQLIALLSTLSGIPVDQGTAVTGSMNQKGEIQMVGGANEKIESFYRLCRSRRLTGRQGVILPRANLSELMLEEDVVEAVDQGKFHVHAVDRLSEAAELALDTPWDQIVEKTAATLERFRTAAQRMP